MICNMDRSAYHCLVVGQLSLEAPARKRRRKSSAPTGIIHLRLEAASASRAASIELKAARKDVQRLASTQPAGAVGSSTIAILDDATHTSDDNDLSQSLGDLFSKLDALVKYVDTFSEVCLIWYSKNLATKRPLRFTHTSTLLGN